MASCCSDFVNRILSVMCMGFCGYKLAEADSEESASLTKSPHGRGESSDCGCHRSRSRKPFLGLCLKDRLFPKKTKPAEDGCFEAMHFFDAESSSTKLPPPPVIRIDPNADKQPPCRPRGPPCTCCLSNHPLRGQSANCASTCEATCGNVARTNIPAPNSDEELVRAADMNGGWTSATRVFNKMGYRSRYRSRRPEKGKQYEKWKGDKKQRENNSWGDSSCYCNVSSRPVEERRKRCNKSNKREDQRQSNKSTSVEERKVSNKSNVIEAPVLSRLPNIDDPCKCTQPSKAEKSDKENEQSSKYDAAEERRPSKISNKNETVLDSEKSNTIEERRPSIKGGESLHESVRSVFDEERRESNNKNVVQEKRLSTTLSANKSFVEDGCPCVTPKRSVDLVLCEKPAVEERKLSNKSNVTGELKPSSKDSFAIRRSSTIVSGIVAGRKRTSTEAAGGVE